MTDTTELLARVERSFHAARELLKAGDVDFAASRPYYGYFYADYTTKPMTDLDKIRQLIDEGEAFLRAARAYRQKSPTG